MTEMPLAIPDCDTFRDMWRDGATIEAIASEFQTGTCVVDRARLRYGYPPRSRGRLLGPMPRSAAPPDPRRAPPDPVVEVSRRVQPTGFERWTIDQIAAVQRSQGRYRRLAELADAWGETVSAVLGLWHRVRVSG